MQTIQKSQKAHRKQEEKMPNIGGFQKLREPTKDKISPSTNYGPKGREFDSFHSRNKPLANSMFARGFSFLQRVKMKNFDSF